MGEIDIVLRTCVYSDSWSGGRSSSSGKNEIVGVSSLVASDSVAADTERKDFLSLIAFREYRPGQRPLR